MISDLNAIYEAALGGVRAGALLSAFDVEHHLGRALSSFRHVRVLGVGKASMAMGGAFEALAAGTSYDGFVTVPHGYAATFPADQRAPCRLDVREAGHPVPDAASASAARRALRQAAEATADDLAVVLISGGGSALWTAPAGGLTLADLQATGRLLLASGASIHEVNTVRKHLSRLKGGQLVRAAAPARLLALVLSDVVGDDLDVIASGPTVPDPSTFAAALGVVRSFGLAAEVPPAVRQHLERGAAGRLAETPKPGDPAFEHAETMLLGTNRHALEAAQAEAERRGYAVRLVTSRLTGEAREVGAALAHTLRDLYPETPTCLLWGGETTVTVRGQGRGGRNQEMTLAAALTLDGAPAPVAFLSGGTDGIDGPTDAAGAWATPATAAAARARGLSPEAHLARNDAYAFFDALGQLLRPGPTHTNVMDVQIGLLRPGA